MWKKIINFFLYLMYIVVLTGVFLYVLFPKDTFKKYIIHEVANKYPNTQLSLNKVIPALPPGLKLIAVQLFYQKDPVFEATYIKLYPLLWTLFQKTTVISFNGQSYDGLINGKIGILNSKQSDPQVTVEANLANINIQKVKALEKISAYKFSGVLGGKITYTNPEPTLTADIKITDTVVELLSPVFDLKSLSFKSVDANVMLINETDFQIKECQFKGNDMDGNISGMIYLRTPMSDSMLDINGSFKPHPPFIAKMGTGFSLFLKRKTGDSGIGFRITGTIEKPNLSLK